MDSLQLRNVLCVGTGCYELCETTTNQKDLIKLVSKTLLQAIFLLQNIGHENNNINTKMIGNNVYNECLNADCQNCIIETNQRRSCCRHQLKDGAK